MWYTTPSEEQVNFVFLICVTLCDWITNALLVCPTHSPINPMCVFAYRSCQPPVWVQTGYEGAESVMRKVPWAKSFVQFLWQNITNLILFGPLKMIFNFLLIMKSCIRILLPMKICSNVQNVLKYMKLQKLMIVFILIHWSKIPIILILIYFILLRGEGVGV